MVSVTQRIHIGPTQPLSKCSGNNSSNKDPLSYCHCCAEASEVSHWVALPQTWSTVDQLQVTGVALHQRPEQLLASVSHFVHVIYFQQVTG